MGTPQNERRGLRGSRSTRLEPQNVWDSFLFAASDPEVPKGDSYFRAETMVSPCAKDEVKKVTLEGRKLEVTLPQQPTTGGEEGLGRIRKWERETKSWLSHVHDQSHEEFLKHAIRIEPIETISRGSEG
jgi:hypothetical protein